MSTQEDKPCLVRRVGVHTTTIEPDSPIIVIDGDYAGWVGYYLRPSPVRPDTHIVRLFAMDGEVDEPSLDVRHFIIYDKG